jgi:hypothetical protein
MFRTKRIGDKCKNLLKKLTEDLASARETASARGVKLAASIYARAGLVISCQIGAR